MKRCLYHYFSSVMPNLSYKMFLETSACQFSASFPSKIGYRMNKLQVFFYKRYPFKFLPSLIVKIVEPFISRFILGYLNIQHICNNVFLRTKIDFTVIIT